MSIDLTLWLMNQMDSTKKIVLFDGVCNFCNKMVNYAIKNDKNGYLKFAALQSTTGISLKQKFQLPENTDSIIFIEGDKAWLYSDAPLQMAKYFSTSAKFLNSFSLIPKFIRDPFYKWVAKNRYRWFGKKDTCMIPDAEVRNRFLE